MSCITSVTGIKLKIEGKADRTAKVYKFICPIFRLDKTSLHQGLEKLSDFIKLWLLTRLPQIPSLLISVSGSWPPREGLLSPRSVTIDGSKRTIYITSLHSQKYHDLTDRRPITSRRNWAIRSITLVEFNTINWRDTTHFDSEDDYRTGCRNVCHCQQQVYSGLRSLGRSNSTYFY